VREFTSARKREKEKEKERERARACTHKLPAAASPPVPVSVSVPIPIPATFPRTTPAKRAVNVSMCNPRKHTFCMAAHILYTWTQIVLQRHTHCVLFIRYACMLVYIGVYEDRWINDVAGCIT